METPIQDMQDSFYRSSNTGCLAPQSACMPPAQSTKANTNETQIQKKYSNKNTNGETNTGCFYNDCSYHMCVHYVHSN